MNALADESTRLGQKSTLIILLKTSVDGEAAPVSFPLDLVDLETLCASHRHNFELFAKEWIHP